MSSLPTRADLASTPNNATAKTAFGALFDFIAQRLARGTSGAGTATTTELASARDSLGVPLPNWLHNPDGAVYQRAVAATADDTYMDDRWYALTQTSTITPSQVSNPEDGYRYALRLTQSQASAQRMGRAQIIEGKDAIPLRGKTVTFGGRMQLSSSANVRLAILAWTGTEDTVTSDVVNDWTSSTYTTGNFFASSNLSLVATGSTALTAGTAGDVSVSGTIPSGATNIIVLYWTEATAAQNVTLDAWGMRLIESAYLNEYIRRSYAQELALCERRYREVPYEAIAASAYLTLAAGNILYWTWPLSVTMASVPAIDSASLTYSAANCASNPSFSATTRSVTGSVLSLASGNTFFAASAGSLKLSADL